ncbi:MAG TPA: divalent-cation tolerance protein CutA [bacterium]|nr:divalent-cation tolerance protein CutA [bacterium]
MIEAAVAMTTTNTEREAKLLASLIVNEKAAACVQIVPKILSVYRWDGEVREDQEYLLMIKTAEKRIDDVRKIIEKNHSYEVPEFVVFPIIDGAEDYMEWIAEVTK